MDHLSAALQEATARARHGVLILKAAQDQALAAAEANLLARQSLASARQGVAAAWWGAGANFLLAVAVVVPLLWRRAFPADRPLVSVGYSVMSGGPNPGSARITNRSSVPLLLEHWELIWVRRSRLIFWKATGLVDEPYEGEEKPSVLKLGESRFFPMDFVTSSTSIKARLARREVVALMLSVAGTRRPFVVGVWPDRVNERRLLLRLDS